MLKRAHICTNIDLKFLQHRLDADYLNTKFLYIQKTSSPPIFLAALVLVTLVDKPSCTRK